nr:hypothetical protein GCM10020063_000530 [Dactylosporangium thailandense]
MISPPGKGEATRLVRAVPVPGRARRSRRVWTGNGRAHIEVRGVDRPADESVAQQLRARLERVRGVHWADDLVDAVEDVEDAHDLRTEGFPVERPDHPGDIEPLLQQAIALGGDALGLLTDAALRALLIAEIDGRRTVWRRREPELSGRGPGRSSATPTGPRSRRWPARWGSRTHAGGPGRCSPLRRRRRHG